MPPADAAVPVDELLLVAEANPLPVTVPDTAADAELDVELDVASDDAEPDEALEVAWAPGTVRTVSIT